MNVNGKKIVITGGNRGIGWAFAEACAAKGARVILAIRKHDPELIEKLEKKGALSAEIIVSDLSSREGVQNLANHLVKSEIDLLFNNAGQLTGGLLENQPLDDIYSMFQVNINALVHLTHAVVPGMVQRKSGKIINHASVSAVMHFPCATTYAASKAAVWAFSDCLEQELKGTGVSTLCLFTPGIKTRMFDQIEELYAQNIDVAKDHIPPEIYAQKILEAVENDEVYLEPSGATGVAFNLARHARGLFNWGVQKKFKR